MSRRLHRAWVRGIAFTAGVGIGMATLSSLAQPLTPPPIAQTNRNPQPPALPPPPKIQSPVQQFLELLAASPAERERLLAERSPENRKSLEAKLREYEALPPEERELRLRATDLRWHLLALMRLPPDRRAEWLAAVPADLRPVVQERLGWWDQLPPDEQAEFLENQAALQFIARLQAAESASERAALRERLTPERQAQLAADLARVRALPPEQRQRLTERLNRFLELSPQEREKTLHALSPAEREQMQSSLEAFAQLPPEQRVQCIAGFTRFAGMSPAEQQQFLRNVERWQSMPPAERENWRRLVQQMSQLPPLPPGLQAGRPPPPPPPLPPPPAR